MYFLGSFVMLHSHRPSLSFPSGLRYALLKASPSATILAAFDINDIANDVYEHNFGHRPLAVDVSNLTVKQLDAWGADIWLMSPPCQPYTRRGLQKQSADARSAGFLCLIDKLQEMKVRNFKFKLEPNFHGRNYIGEYGTPRFNTIYTLYKHISIHWPHFLCCSTLHDTFY